MQVVFLTVNRSVKIIQYFVRSDEDHKDEPKMVSSNCARPTFPTRCFNHYLCIWDTGHRDEAVVFVLSESQKKTISVDYIHKVRNSMYKFTDSMNF